MSKTTIKLGDTVTLYDRVTDARTGVPVDLSAYNELTDTLQILFVKSTDSTVTTTKTAALMSPTGTAAFTNGSAVVTGTGTKFYDEFTAGDWIRKTGDTVWGVVKSIDSDTHITLTATYGGAGGSAAIDVRGKIYVTLTSADITSAGTYFAETLVDIASKAHRGENNVLVVEPKLSSFVSPQ